MRLFALVVLCVAFSGVALADPPKSVQVDYDPSSNTLSLVVVHSVSSPQKHYVDKITVRLEKETLFEQEYEEQTDTAGMRVTLPLERSLEAGTELEIRAGCSRFGSKKVKYVIPATASAPPSAAP